MKTKILFAVISLLLLIGCNSNYQREGFITKQDITGTKGLVMEIQDSPKEVFENSPFNLRLNINNDGAENIENGYISIGVEKDFVEVSKTVLRGPIQNGGSKDKIRFSLEGKSLLDRLGQEGVIGVNFNSKSLESLRELHQTAILLTSCYPYTTKLSKEVCIDSEDIGKETLEKACKVEDKKLDSQGAPVAITEIEVNMLEDEERIKPKFIIHIQNKGPGTVIKKDKIEAACSSESIQYSDFNAVSIKASLFDKPLVCSNDGVIKLKEGKDEIVCDLKEGISKEEGTHSETLNIVLDYGYTQTVSTIVDIKKLPN